jgi:endonuclease YncB( thermonuclease family)
VLQPSTASGASAVDSERRPAPLLRWATHFAASHGVHKLERFRSTHQLGQSPTEELVITRLGRVIQGDLLRERDNSGPAADIRLAALDCPPSRAMTRNYLHNYNPTT